MELAVNISHIISAIIFFILSVFFADSLAVHFDLKTAVKSLGFLALCFTQTANIFMETNTLIFWAYIASFLLIYIGFILDPYSKFKFSFLLIPLLFFVKGHLLLLILTVLIALAIFQLVYITQHSDFIPLGVSFVLISVGEYFYFLESIESLKTLSAAGSFLYIFAAILLFVWIWSYIAIRVVSALRNRD